MRPKRSSPTGVAYSAQARLTRMLSRRLLMPDVGVSEVVVLKPIGTYPLRALTEYPLDDGVLPYPSGVEPSTKLSNRSIWLMTRRLSEMCSSGSSRKRRLPIICVLFLQPWVALVPLLLLPTPSSSGVQSLGPVSSPVVLTL